MQATINCKFRKGEPHPMTTQQPELINTRKQNNGILARRILPQRTLTKKLPHFLTSCSMNTKWFAQELVDPLLALIHFPEVPSHRHS